MWVWGFFVLFFLFFFGFVFGCLICTALVFALSQSV